MINYISKLFSFQQSYKKGEIIKCNQDNCEYIGFIAEGEIKIVDYNIDSKESIIKLLKQYDFFGNNLIYSSLKKYPYYIIAKTNSLIMYINKENFEKELSKNISFLKEYLYYLSKQYVQMQNLINIYKKSSLKEKIMVLIKYKCRENNSNFFSYKSHNEMAELLCVQRSSFSRSLYQLENEKKIKISHKKIYILNI